MDSTALKQRELQQRTGLTEQKTVQQDTGFAPVQSEVTAAASSLQVTGPADPELIEASKKAFDDYWGSDTVDDLMSQSISIDLKNAIRRDPLRDDTASERKSQNEWRDSLKDMTLFNSGRTEKSRKNHLSRAAAGYEKAAMSFQQMRADRRAFDKSAEGATEEQKAVISGQILENVSRSEETIRLVCTARAETVKAGGKRDEEEKKQLDAVKEQQLTMLLNLYQMEAKNPNLLPADKDKLMQRALRLQVYKDSTLTRLSFADEDLVSEFKDHEELTDKEVFDMSEANVYNKDQKLFPRMWGRFGETKDGKVQRFPSGWKFGYICTGNSFLVNQYLRALNSKQNAEARMKAAESGFLTARDKLKAAEGGAGDPDAAAEELAKAQLELQGANDQMSRALSEMRSFKDAWARRYANPKYMEKRPWYDPKRFLATWRSKTEGLIDDLDMATGMKTAPGMRKDDYRLPHDSRFYRMVDGSILNWGFGLSGIDGSALKNASDLKDPEAIVETLNKQAGTVITDHGVMSTGWCVDQAFVNRPIMMTILTDKGKRCFVTKNFKEGEVVFERNSRYQLVCAINHTHDAQTLRKSHTVSDMAKSADELKSDETVRFSGIELVVKMLPNPDETPPKEGQ